MAVLSYANNTEMCSLLKTVVIKQDWYCYDYTLEASKSHCSSWLLSTMAIQHKCSTWGEKKIKEEYLTGSQRKWEHHLLDTDSRYFHYWRRHNTYVHVQAHTETCRALVVTIELEVDFEPPDSTLLVVFYRSHLLYPPKYFLRFTFSPSSFIRTFLHYFFPSLLSPVLLSLKAKQGRIPQNVISHRVISSYILLCNVTSTEFFREI